MQKAKRQIIFLLIVRSLRFRVETYQPYYGKYIGNNVLKFCILNFSRI